MKLHNTPRSAALRAAVKNYREPAGLRTILRNLAHCVMPAVIIVFLLCCGVPAARADYAVLRSGQRLHITGWEQLGDIVRLNLDGGSITLPAAELVSVEPEEIFPASPPQAPAPALQVPYGEQIRAAASQNGVDPMLVASIISVESNFNSRAVSPKSAFGLMQLRPKTAANFAVSNIFDPQQNIAAGTRYLKELLDRYAQNLPLALAAYNAGPARVAQYRGIPPFAETRDYIRRVNAKLQTQKIGTQTSATQDIGGSDAKPLWPLWPAH